MPLILLAAASCITGFFKAPLEHYLEIHFEASVNGVVLASCNFSSNPCDCSTYSILPLLQKTDNFAVFSARSFLNNPLYLLISNGYYFDAVYSKILSGVMGLSQVTMSEFVETSGIQQFPYVVAGGASKTSSWHTSNYIETFLDRFVYVIAGGAVITAHKTHVHLDAFLDRFCYILAGGTVETARVTHEYIDTFLDKMVYLFAGKTVEQGQKLKKMHRGPSA